MHKHIRIYWYRFIYKPINVYTNIVKYLPNLDQHTKRTKVRNQSQTISRKKTAKCERRKVHYRIVDPFSWIPFTKRNWFSDWANIMNVLMHRHKHRHRHIFIAAYLHTHICSMAHNVALYARVRFQLIQFLVALSSYGLLFPKRERMVTILIKRKWYAYGIM